MRPWLRLVLLLGIELVLLAGAFGRHAALERGSQAVVLPFREYWMGQDFSGGYAELILDVEWKGPQPFGEKEWGWCWAIFEQDSPAWRLIDVRKREAIGAKPPTLEPNRVAIEGSYGGESVSLRGARRVRVDDAEFAELKARYDRDLDSSAAPESGPSRAKVTLGDPAEAPADTSRASAQARADSLAKAIVLHRSGIVEARVLRGRIFALRNMSIEGRAFAR